MLGDSILIEFSDALFKFSIEPLIYWLFLVLKIDVRGENFYDE